MSKLETDILKRIMMEASTLGARVWRNHTGAVEGKNGQWHRFGLCNGSADLIGIYKGVFLAIEVKSPKGRVTPEQMQFLTVINQFGGIGIVCDDEKRLKKLIDTHQNCP